LKKDINVTLKIYNILGQEIKTFVNEFQTAGYKTIIWDGTNNNGVVFSSGVYLLRLAAGEFVEIKKMLVIK
jgi:flagellar hook assembly protein FlgD